MELNSLKPGTEVQARVIALRDFQMNVVIGDNLPGRVHLCELRDVNPGADDVVSTDGVSPFSAYHIGDVMVGRIIGFRHGNFYELTLSEQPDFTATPLVELTLRPRCGAGVACRPRAL